MPKEKIPVQVNADDADLLAAPPRCVERSLVRIANQTCNRHRALAMPKRPMRKQSGKSAVDWVGVLHDG